MQPFGTHILLDLWGIRADLLRDAASLEGLLVDAVRKAGGSVVSAHFNQFSPHGASGVVLIAESHVAIHTWPEDDFAALDVFTCGGTLVADRIARELVARLAPARHERRDVLRGAGAPGGRR